MTAIDLLSRDTAGLPLVERPTIRRLRDGDRLALDIAPVIKVIGGSTVRMIAYNGSIPGPTLHVDQGSEIVVDVTNNGDVETTVHWHGLRLDNRYDGVPVDTQTPIEIGGVFSYRLTFPDAGFYWYHPHLREDYGQEMGMYGTIIVEPSDADYWPPVDRQLSITLDDLLIEDGMVAPFSRSGPTFTAMGRFGNVLLVNGEERLDASVALGEVVRLHLVNTANTRIFNVAIPDARMKLVGGDSGRYQREAFVEEILLAPSERAIVDVQFDRAGVARFEHRTPDTVYDLGAFSVASTNRRFADLRVDHDLTTIAAGLVSDRDRAPDKVLAFRSTMPLLYRTDAATASSFACPMHPEVTSVEAGRCPKCGMRLTPIAAAEADGPAAVDPGHDCLEGDGLEWEDLMPEINRQSDASNMHWCLTDLESGAENHAIFWTFTVGDRVKIRLVNELGSDHPMHHPFHIHGAGRFLILARDGAPDENLVWKDTVLVPAGQTVDILLEITNPGRWMAHCHIAEHIESGMMFSFDVLPGR